MGLESTFARIIAIFILAVTPGPGIFAIIARTLAGYAGATRGAVAVS